MHGTKKMVTALCTVALAAGLSGLVATGASAADGDQFLATSLPAPGGLLGEVGVSTSLTPTTSYGQAHYADAGTGTMYDANRYAIGLNPANLHEFWADWSGNLTPTLFVNGGTDGAQLVWGKTVQTEPCTTPGSTVTYTFKANAANIVDPQYTTEFDTGALITVKINGTVLGSANTSGHTAADVIEITGAVPVSDGTLNIEIWNGGLAYSGNDFGISNLSLVQNGTCEPPCENVVNGVWFNYTGNYKGVGAPALTDPKWHALPAQPGGEHALSKRGFNLPYNPGADKGKGDWFVWKDLGTTCPA